MAKVTRGFTGRPRPAGDRRLPPGQYDTGADWPVLTAEPTPTPEPTATTSPASEPSASPTEEASQAP